MKWHTRLSVLLLLLIRIVIVECLTNNESNDPNDDLFCAVLNPQTGQYIDLSHLSSTPNEVMDPKKKRQESSKTKWLVKGWGDDKDKNFTLSICSSPINDDKSKNKPPSMGQLTNKTGAYYTERIKSHKSGDKDDTYMEIFNSIGDFSVKPQLYNSNNRKLILKYENGSYCPDGHYKKSSLLNFVCDREITTKAQISYIGNLNDCAYFFEVRSVYACPTSNKTNEINVLGIFIGIIIVFILVQYLRRSMQRRITLKDNTHNSLDRDNSVIRDNSYFRGTTTERSSSEIALNQPNWEFFDNRSVLTKFLNIVQQGVRTLVSPIAQALGNNRRYTSRNGRDNSNGNSRPIRLYSSPFASNSQTSFLRDMEIQNNILDSLEVTSETTTTTNGNSIDGISSTADNNDDSNNDDIDNMA
ncbi:similar to Saccharomyces cerevisiae YPR079W MRL1 Membrane protein with similarity to mammalian mannose-6-phosphate receptors [Maudiozyma saulgeensis]|uniref:Similar to Saccharomyces cerevisiae YPR079W MRL1 Membrane protein with similarity to mammalian mannose-6-phosphate receptors n=1 Tax=Maudiozyma saulgeensis TaxID=1789683 RepID=A0A1X7R3Y3_9SACH|nr:similar to Saccharomyces cerevisiae YPR079W MRL1 Membrane protein with similarity to mammalian mannose-6-phosphate receptors [Kazachstania saulgeensis]